MSNDFNAEDYESTVECIAEEALQDYSGDSRDEFIRESVDGNSYIIYYAGNDTVKQASKNYGNDWREINAMAGDDASDDRIKTVASYEAMIADVYDWIRENEDEFETCDNCGNMYESDDMTAGGECVECTGDFCNDCLEEHNGKDYCEDCKPDEDEEPVRNEDDDYTYTPSGNLGSRTSVSCGTQFIGEFSTDEEALQAIREHAKEWNVFPNVWHISDHGNEHLIKDFNWDE